jgi:hypothetical protein
MTEFKECQIMRSRSLSVTFTVAATLLLSLSASAQVYGPSTEGHRSPQSTKAASAAPKPAYDPHDLSGVWWGRNFGFMNGAPWPNFTDDGRKLFEANKPGFGPTAVLPALGNDPQAHCNPLGYPRAIFQNGRPMEIVMAPSKIWMIFEWTRGQREIWTDGRQIPEDADPRWYGYAVGHWDGNKLIVHSADYNEGTWLDQAGDPHDGNMAVDEVIEHPDAETLQDTITIKDPTVYVAPLSSWAPLKFQLQGPKGVTELREEYCAPSEEESFNQNTRDRAAGIAKPVEVK